MAGPRLQGSIAVGMQGLPVGQVSVQTQIALLPLALKNKCSYFRKLLRRIGAQGCWSFPTLALTEIAVESAPCQDFCKMQHTLDTNR